MKNKQVHLHKHDKCEIDHDFDSWYMYISYSCRADNAAYPHDSRADKRRHRHDCSADSQCGFY